MRYDPNGASFDESGLSGTNDADTHGQIAVSWGGWIQCNFYRDPDNGSLRGFSYDAVTHEFSDRDGKGQPYKIDEMLISPFDGTIVFDNELEQGGTLEQNTYPYINPDGYNTVAQTPYDDAKRH